MTLDTLKNEAIMMLERYPEQLIDLVEDSVMDRHNTIVKKIQVEQCDYDCGYVVMIILFTDLVIKRQIIVEVPKTFKYFSPTASFSACIFSIFSMTLLL